MIDWTRCSVRTMFGKDAEVVESRAGTCRCGNVVMYSRCRAASKDGWATGWTTDLHDGCNGEAWADDKITPTRVLYADPVLVSRVRRFWAGFGYDYDNRELMLCADRIVNGKTWTQMNTLGDIVLTMERLNA